MHALNQSQNCHEKKEPSGRKNSFQQQIWIKFKEYVNRTLYLEKKTGHFEK